MSRRERFTPYEKEQACLDYINGNRSRFEICKLSPYFHKGRFKIGPPSIKNMGF